MSMPETLDDPLLTADYRQAPGVYDEMCVEPGVLRPHWDRISLPCPRWAVRSWLIAGRSPASVSGKTA